MGWWGLSGGGGGRSQDVWLFDTGCVGGTRVIGGWVGGADWKGRRSEGGAMTRMETQNGRIVVVEEY